MIDVCAPGCTGGARSVQSPIARLARCEIEGLAGNEHFSVMYLGRPRNRFM